MLPRVELLTENGRDAFIRRAPSLQLLMLEMPGWKDRQLLFRSKPASRIDAVNKFVTGICPRLGQRYFRRGRLTAARRRSMVPRGGIEPPTP